MADNHRKQIRNYTEFIQKFKREIEPITRTRKWIRLYLLYAEVRKLFSLNKDLEKEQI